MTHLKISKASGSRASLRLGVKRPTSLDIMLKPIVETDQITTISWFHGNKVWNGDSILPDIYIGSLNDAQCFQELKDLGINRCVNCGGPECFYNKEPGTQLGIEYLDIPFPDDESFKLTFELFSNVLDFIKKAYADKSAVLVHCFKGISRSSTVVIGILMHLYDMTFEAAYKHVAIHRSIVAPNMGFSIKLIALFENESYGRFCHQFDLVKCCYHEENPKVEKHAVTILKNCFQLSLVDSDPETETA